MKKYNIVYLLTWTFIILLSCFALSYQMQSSTITLLTFLIMGVFLTFTLGFFMVFFLAFPLSYLFARITMMRWKELFRNTDCLFKSSSGIFYIDTKNGEINAITTGNPFRLQVINAAKLEDIRVNDGRSAFTFGGTRNVSFCFTVNQSVCKVSVLTTRRTFSMVSIKVQRAIEVAEFYVTKCSLAKEVALKK